MEGALVVTALILWKRFSCDGAYKWSALVVMAFILWGHFNYDGAYITGVHINGATPFGLYTGYV